jgi:hypothetical protein
VGYSAIAYLPLLLLERFCQERLLRVKTLDVAEGKVGERGLVTVPVAIQKALGLQKGDWIVWAVTNQHVEVRKK